MRSITLKTIDCRSLNCPKPVIMTKKEIEEGIEKDLEVIVDNITAKENISKLLNSLSIIFNIEKKEDDFYIKFNKENSVYEEKENISGKKIDNDLVVMIDSNTMGKGNEELGRVLAKGFIYALTEIKLSPKSLLFVNSGIDFTTEGSDSLEDLKILMNKGTKILSCGACLDFYDKKDKLVIGEVTNMYNIVEELSSTIKVLKI